MTDNIKAHNSHDISTKNASVELDTFINAIKNARSTNDGLEKISFYDNIISRANTLLEQNKSEVSFVELQKMMDDIFTKSKLHFLKDEFTGEIYNIFRTSLGREDLPEVVKSESRFTSTNASKQETATER